MGRFFRFGIVLVIIGMSFFKKIHSYLHLQGSIVNSVNGYNSVLMTHAVNDLRFHIKYDNLSSLALSESTPGVSNEIFGDSEVIVSLTTHGKRIYDVHATIESIMRGSVKPNRIVLWLSEDYKHIILPLALQKQTSRGLEIRYCKDIRSYTKLIPALKEFPEASIITIDDDIIYPYDLIECLVNAHIERPECICANWIREIPNNLGKQYISLLKWPQLFNTDDISNRFFFEGFAGVLYPPHSLDAEVFNKNVFLDICKYADDVWFNAMALKAGTKVKYAWKHYSIDSFINNSGVQCVALRHINNEGSILNDKQIKAVYGKYGLWRLL